MPNDLKIMMLLAVVSFQTMNAQSAGGKPVWETLRRVPVPQETLPKLNVLRLPTFAPAPPVPREAGAGHTHAGPVFGYVLSGAVEILVEPDPPGVYRTGEVFYEIPLHLHRYVRNVSRTEPADVLIFQAGDTGQRAPAIKLLLEVPFQKAANQEVSLHRLSLPAGAGGEAPPHSGAGIVYVLEGKLEVLGVDPPKSYGAGELFEASANAAGLRFRNASGSETADLLLYELTEGAH